MNMVISAIFVNRLKSAAVAGGSGPTRSAPANI